MKTNQTTDRPSFLLYKSFYEPIKHLKDEELGLLFRAIFDHQNGLDIKISSPQVAMAFAFFKNQFVLDRAKYQLVIDRNKSNGSKGGRPKTQKTQANPKNPVGFQEPKKPEKENDKDIILLEDSKGDFLKNQNPLFGEQENKILDLKNEKSKKKSSAKRTKKEFIAPTLEEIKAYCIERNSPIDPKYFFDFYSTGNWQDNKGNAVKNWKQKLITWEGRAISKPNTNNNFDLDKWKKY